MEDFPRCVCVCWAGGFWGGGGKVSTDEGRSPKLALTKGGSRGNIES